MRLLLESIDRAMLLDRAALLQSRGIPVHLDDIPHVGAIPSHLYVVFDKHFDDAKSLLLDAEHPVAQPMYDDELAGISAEVREVKLSIGNTIAEQLMIAALVLLSVIYVAARVFD